MTLQEFVTAADKRFALLDHNHDGRITRDDLPPLGSLGEGGRSSALR